MASKSNSSRADIIELFDGYDWSSVVEQMEVLEQALQAALVATEGDWVARETGGVAPVNLDDLANEPPEIRSIGVAILLRAIATAYKGEVRHVGNRNMAAGGSPAEVLAAFATVRR
jgi:hypothetical protein